MAAWNGVLGGSRSPRIVRDDDAWVVRSHGRLASLAENLWWTWGSLPGIAMKRTMVLARRRDGDLVVHNAIALDDTAMRELEAIGEPRYLLVPNAGQQLDVPAFKRRYPKIQVFAPRGERDAIAKTVEVDGIYEDFPADDDVQLEMLHGVADAEGALVVSSSDGVTFVLDDGVFAIERGRDALGMLFWSLRSALGSRARRPLFVRDRAALREDLERFAAHPELVRLVHGDERIAKGVAAATALREAANGLGAHGRDRLPLLRGLARAGQRAVLSRRNAASASGARKNSKTA